MSNSILAVPACPHNPPTLFYQDTARLTHLFLIAYQYHFDQPEAQAGNFITQLKQLVATGYRACRQHPHRRKIYNLCRQQFLQYDEGDFRKHLSIVDTLAENLAKMVQWAVQSYQAAKYLEESEKFLELLETLLVPEKIVSFKQREYAYQLLEELRELF